MKKEQDVTSVLSNINMITSQFIGSGGRNCQCCAQTGDADDLLYVPGTNGCRQPRDPGGQLEGGHNARKRSEAIGSVCITILTVATIETFF